MSAGMLVFGGVSFKMAFDLLIYFKFLLDVLTYLTVDKRDGLQVDHQYQRFDVFHFTYL